MASTPFRPLAFLRYWALERNTEQFSATHNGKGSADEPLESFADYVISFRYTSPKPANRAAPNSTQALLQAEGQQVARDQRQAECNDAASALADLVRRLSRAGLDLEVREALSPKKAPGHARNGPEAEGSTTSGGSGADAFTVDPGHLLIFVRCRRGRLLQEWSRSRLHDWLGGMLPLRRVPRGVGLPAVDPFEVDPEMHDDPSRLLEASAGTAEDISPSERQRLVHKLIVGPASEGCAAVNVEGDPWVESVFPLHDRSFNKKWVKHWSSKWLIDRHDLRRIREHFGEEIAMYFAFLQSYFLWLSIPAAFGTLWWLLGWSFSWQFGILLVLWSVLFTETWARRESDIATYWGVHGVQKVSSLRRPNFRPDRHVVDPATGEPVPFFSNGKRWLRRLLGIPVVLVLALLMALFVSFIFALQTFVSEYYDGPLHTLLGFTPIILFSACLPVYTSVCTRIAGALTEYENYEYESEYVAQYTTKIFVFQFLQDQLYLFLTAWVFVPQRDSFELWLRGAYDSIRGLPPWMVPFLARTSEKSSTASAYVGLKSSSTPATDMVQSLLTSFVVTSQIINLMTETGIPLLMRWWSSRLLARASRMQAAQSKPANDTTGLSLVDDGSLALDSIQQGLAQSAPYRGSTGVDQWVESISDLENAVAPADIQRQFIARVTEETCLPEYSTYEDYAEMASQFGRVAFFSVAWPLAPLAAFLNNWLELRTDAAKICGATKRPIPRRVDTIGPWLETLRFMCWLSSITNALLIYQFHPNCAFLPTVAEPETMMRFGRTSLSFALIVLLCSEHMFLIIRWAITHVMASWPGAYARILERSQAQSKRRWLERTRAVSRDFVAADDSAAEGSDEPESIQERSGVAQAPFGREDWRSELEYGLQAINDAFKLE
ncbi:hypothetical protein IWW37_004600 [Coemansia sp. RSA 2050]|nr:hypothetical protein IWW37_004600 [Coemansia sp. RSA 2050]KAJ2734966.1 hypothetical protein IW152_001948 [Coemansia sp. BCRC 34962]